MAAKQWYFRETSGAEYGPLSGDELRTLVRSGRVGRETLVSTGSRGTWVAAGRVKGLFPDGEPGPGRGASTDSASQHQGYFPPRGVAPNNVFALASLISGVLGWTIVPVVGAAVAIAAGHIALRQLERGDGREEGKTLATIGLILGYVEAGLLFVAAISLFILGIGISGFLTAFFHQAGRAAGAQARWRPMEPPRIERPGDFAPAAPPFPDFRGNVRPEQARAPARTAARGGEGDAEATRKAMILARQFGGELSWDSDRGENPGSDRLLQTLAFDKSQHWADLGLARRLTDAGLAELKGSFPGEFNAGFQKLILADVPITDEGLAQLRGMDRLEFLDLAGTRATARGLTELLPTLPRLRTLRLGVVREMPDGSVEERRMAVTDEALVAVSRSPRLRWLEVSGTMVTDSGLATIAGLKALERLDLNGTKVTDAGLVHVKDLECLCTLNLAGTDVTDAGLVHLADHPQLLMLDLNNTAITDRGLAFLASMPKMRLGNRQDGRQRSAGYINLSRTKVTASGLVKLREGLPNVSIFPEPIVAASSASKRPTRGGSKVLAPER